MKAIKCFFAITVGVIVGLLSACTAHKHPRTQPVTHGPTAAEGVAATQAPSSETQPAKEPDLPIRRPILE